LAQDVALICQNHRQLARALLEAQDVIKAAIAVTKKESDNGTAQTMQHEHKKASILPFVVSGSSRSRRETEQ
jgi:hypothetical protein